MVNDYIPDLPAEPWPAQGQFINCIDMILRIFDPFPFTSTMTILLHKTLEWTFLEVYYRTKELGRNYLLAKNLIYGHETINLASKNDFYCEDVNLKKNNMLKILIEERTAKIKYDKDALDKEKNHFR